MLREAWRRVAARPRLIAALVALHVAVALIASAPLSATLAPLVDGRPAAAAMVAGDDGLAGELMMDHPELVRVAASGAQAGVLVYGLVSWILAGGLLAALAGLGGRVTALDGDGDGDVVGARAVAEACGRNAARMVRVGVCGLPLRLIPIAGATGAWFAVKWLTGRGFTELVLASLVVLLVFGALWSFLTVAVDYARALALLTPELGAFRAIGRGLTLAFRRFGATARLAAFSGFGFAGVTALYLVVAMRLPHQAALAAILLTLLRLAVAFARAFVTTTTLVAAALTAGR